MLNTISLHALQTYTQTTYLLWPDQDWRSCRLKARAGDGEAKEGAQTASALASFPTHRAPVTAQREERPPSRTQGTFLFAWLPLHNLSEKSTVSPFSLPRGSFWQSMKYCV